MLCMYVCRCLPIHTLVKVLHSRHTPYHKALNQTKGEEIPSHSDELPKKGE